MFECVLLISCVINYNILPCRCLLEQNKFLLQCIFIFVTNCSYTYTHTNKINFDCAILPTDFCMYSGDIRTNSDNYLEIGINTIKQKIK